MVTRGVGSWVGAAVALAVVAVSGCSSTPPSVEKVPHEFRDDVKPRVYRSESGTAPYALSLVPEDVSEPHRHLLGSAKSVQPPKAATVGEEVEVGVTLEALEGTRVRVALFEVPDQSGFEGMDAALRATPIAEKDAERTGPASTGEHRYAPFRATFKVKVEERLVKPGKVVPAAVWALSILVVDADGCIERQVFTASVIVPK